MLWQLVVITVTCGQSPLKAPGGAEEHSVNRACFWDSDFSDAAGAISW